MGLPPAAAADGGPNRADNRHVTGAELVKKSQGHRDRDRDRGTQVISFWIPGASY